MITARLGSLATRAHKNLSKKCTVSDTWCRSCPTAETMQHVLLECKSYEPHRSLMWDSLPAAALQAAESLSSHEQLKLLLGGDAGDTHLTEEELREVDTCVKEFLLDIDDLRTGEGEGSLFGYVQETPAESLELALSWERQTRQELDLEYPT